MDRNKALMVAGAVLVAFGVGIGVGKFFDRGLFGARDGSGRSLASRTDEDDATRYGFQEVRSASEARAAAEKAKTFTYDRLLLETNGDTPRACLQFTRELDASGKTNYADYVRLTPDVKPAVNVAGSSLCIAGLEFNKEYKARIRSGTPAKSGERLERPIEVTIAFGDKPSYVGFAGDGVVLPRLEADGIGFETVNVDTLGVAIYRVSDRSLARKSIVAGGAASEEDYMYVYGEEDGEDVGVKVFEKDIKVDRRENQTVTTVFPLGAALPNLKAGAYFIKLRDKSNGANNERGAQSWRWVMFTDLAMTTYSSSEGVDVFVRSIANGRPLAGVDLELVAANNDMLARVSTDRDGRARFEKAVVSGEYPLTPRMIMAYGPQDDFAALDLNRAPLDLSDRNIDGRAAPSVIDAYIYLDRGVYRPGETVRISGMVRDSAGKAVDRPVTLTITRPNWTESQKTRFDKLDIGGFTTDFEIPKSAPRGVWRMELTADGAGVVGSETFSVEDFVPQRLEVKVGVDEKTPMRGADARQIAVEARYLYGAPAGSLAVESEARLRLDPNPFPALAGYRFGPADEAFDERLINLAAATTDANGKTSVSLRVDSAPKKYGAPMRADLVVGVVEPGGRVVRESARIPVRPDDKYVGLKLSGDGGGFAENQPAEIDAVVVDWRGAETATSIEWRLVEEDYWFDWYRQDGEWRWRRSYKDVLVAEGRTEAKASGAARISQTLDAGSYRLTATDPVSGAKTDIRFYVGWRSYESGAETPDQATLTLSGENVAPGSKAKLVLDPPYGGEAIIAIATDRVHRVERIKVENKAREIIIETDPNWGAGFYVLATVVTPRDAAKRPIPRRAMGIAYVPFDMTARKLTVDLGTPDLVRPRAKVVAPVKVAGAARGETVMLTVAAVDEGILRLTKFASPDPVEHYYGKKRLGVEIRDDYGRILDPNLAAAANFGGDQIGGEGLTVVPVKSIALFSGPIKLDANGAAQVPLNVPDFNGELRLMAVAWSADKIGSNAKPLTVRDPVPAVLSLPRFLGPDDKAQATLLIDNVDGAAGEYTATVSGGGPVAATASTTKSLGQKQQSTALLPLSAGDVGVGDVKLAVAGPKGFAVSRSYPIQVRTPYFPITESTTRNLAAGEKFSLDKTLIDNLVKGSTAVSVSFSRLKGVDPGPLVDSLYRYPYGCTEQLTSTAMPLLYLDELGAEVGRKSDLGVRPRVQEAINQLLNRQTQDGAFGLWSEGDASATAWLGAYVTDFLFRAKEEGYGVPDHALEKSYEALAKVARVDRWVYIGYNMQAYEGPWSNDTTDQLRRRSAAYAYYVLARAGKADLSDIRYLHDAFIDDVTSPLAKAHLGAALAVMGDRARAVSAFEKAIAALGHQNTGDYYQTPLRDAAGVLALLAELQNAPGVNNAADRLVGFMKDPDSMQTQEKAFLLMATQALLRTSGPVSIKRNSDAATTSPSPRFAVTADDLGKGVEFTNGGDGQIFATVSVYGSPKTAPAPAAQGFTLTKRIARRDGSPVDLAAVKQNDRLVIVISGAAQSDRVHPAVIADLLPAGFEIESIISAEESAGEGGPKGPYKWVGPISWLKISEARDDRFVAAIDLYAKDPFTLAYLVRAVTPGEYVFPGAVIEDMYRPGVFGRTGVTKVKISAPAPQ